VTEGPRKLLDRPKRALWSSETQLKAGGAEFVAGWAYAKLLKVQALLRERGFRSEPTAWADSDSSTQQ
jgi:hypothetical protein